MEAPRLYRWESLTKRQFDWIDRVDRSQAVVLVTLNPLMIALSNRLLGFRNSIA